MPIIGKETFSLISLISRTEFARIPTAPAFLAAYAKYGIKPPSSV